MFGLSKAERAVKADADRFIREHGSDALASARSAAREYRNLNAVEHADYWDERTG